MKHFVLSLGIGLLAACSSDSQQTEEQLENDINQNSENTSDDAANQNSGENGDAADNSDENQSTDADGQEADSSDGEAEAEASAETEAAAADPMDTPMDAIAAGGEFGGGDSAAMAEVAPAAVPGNATVASAAAAPSSAMPPSQLWDANRQVRFVKSDGTPIYPATQTSSQPITRLQRGDHVVVLVHGGWAMLSDGAYIEESALSSTALPRSRKQNPWIPPSE